MAVGRFGNNFSVGKFEPDSGLKLVGNLADYPDRRRPLYDEKKKRQRLLRLVRGQERRVKEIAIQ